MANKVKCAIHFSFFSKKTEKIHPAEKQNIQNVQFIWHSKK